MIGSVEYISLLIIPLFILFTVIYGSIKKVRVYDSFVAGAGIEDRRDRFGDLLAAALGETAVVFTAAGPGWSTLDEAAPTASKVPPT